MHFFLLLNTNEDIMKNVGNETVDGPHSRKKKYYGIQWLPSKSLTFWLPTFFKISSFVFNRGKKLIKV